MTETADVRTFLTELVASSPQKAEYTVPICYDGEQTELYFQYQWNRKEKCYKFNRSMPQNDSIGYYKAFQKYRMPEGIAEYLEEHSIVGWTPRAFIYYGSYLTYLVERQGEMRLVYFYRENDRSGLYEHQKIDEVRLLTLQQAMDELVWDIVEAPTGEVTTDGQISSGEEKELVYGVGDVDSAQTGTAVLPEEESEQPMNLWFLLPVGAAVLIAAGAVLLALKKRK